VQAADSNRRRTTRAASSKPPPEKPRQTGIQAHQPESMAPKAATFEFALAESQGVAQAQGDGDFTQGFLSHQMARSRDKLPSGKLGTHRKVRGLPCKFNTESPRNQAARY